jgi:PncC family amidohydrolase
MNPIIQDENVAQSIQEWCISNERTISLAESCTGGSLAARLTAIPDCSLYFLGSIVAYSNEMKKKVLGVSESLLLENGAVSAQVAEAMAEGVLKLTGSDYSLAVTGIAGPGGGTEEKPVGFVWAAIATKVSQTVVCDFRLSGNRQEIIQGAVQTILTRFHDFLVKGEHD